MGKIIYIILACLVTGIDLGIAFIVFRRKKKNTKFFGMAALIAGLAEISYTISILMTNYFCMKLALAVFFSCIPIMLYCLTIFFRRYVKIEMTHGRQIRKKLAEVLIITDVILQFVNLFYEIVMKFEFHPEYVVAWGFVPQILYRMHLVLCYILIAAICYYIFAKIIATPAVYKAKYYTIVFALLVAVAFNAFCLIFQGKGMPDYSQISYCLLALILFWDIFHNTQRGMLNSVRKVMLDELGHPVILFGEENNVAICNEPISFLVPGWTPGMEYNLEDFLKKWGFNPGLATETEDTYFQWNYFGRGITITYRVDFCVIKDKKQKVVGRMFVFTDMSLEMDLLTEFHSKPAYERYFLSHTTGFKYPVAVAVCDINQLSKINRIHGEDVGDQCILHLSRMMQKHMPQGTYFARLNDANLLAVSENTTNEQMHQYLEEIENECRENNPEKIKVDVQSAVCIVDGAENNILKAGETASYTLKSRKLLDRNSSHSSLLDSFAQTLLESDETTENHVLRTQELGELLGRRLNFTDKQMSDLALLCLLHDIGKLGIPLEILNKPGKLTAEEWDVMKSHTEKGYRIAMASSELAGIADYILHHHERWDGKGYPDGLERESIPLLSRVIAVIDAYDAMVYDRPYHRAVSEKKAREELKRCAGTQFDPYIVSEFILLLEKIRPLNSIEEEAAKELSMQSGDFGIKEMDEGKSDTIISIRYTEYQLDENNRIISIDDAFTELTGYTEEDLETYQLSQWDLVPKEDIDIYMHTVEKEIGISGKTFLEHRLRRKDGSFRYVFCFGKKKYDVVSKKIHSTIIAFDAAKTNAMKEMRERERESAKREIERWEELLRKDSLTGVLNHEAFINDAEIELLNPQKTVGMVILDVDYFKQYNDNYGHMNGDRLLQMVAKSLQKQVKEKGFAGRLGGDEFVAIIAVDHTNCSKEQAEEEIRSHIETVFKAVMAEITVLPKSTSISLGGAIAKGEKTAFRKLYQSADKALYWSKEHGRGCYHISEM